MTTLMRRGSHLTRTALLICERKSVHREPVITELAIQEDQAEGEELALTSEDRDVLGKRCTKICLQNDTFIDIYNLNKVVLYIVELHIDQKEK